MIKPMRFLTFLFLLVVIGCGGGTMTQPPVAFNAPPLSGSFSFIGTSQNSNTTTIFVGGALQRDSSGQVSGTMGITTNPNVTTCFPAGSNAAFSGTINGQGQLMLTSAPVAGQVITLNATVSSDGNFFSKSTYSVAGGCLGGDQGGVFASHLLNGTYTGSFFAGGSLVNVSVNFGQPGMPSATGTFPITAGATFTNTAPCGGFSSAGTEGAQSGLAVGFTLASNVAGTSLTFSGTSIDSSGTMFSGSVAIVGGPCDTTQAAITLKKT